MDPNVLGIIVALVSFLFLLSGMPIAFGLGVPSVVFILLFMDRPQFDLMAHIVYDGVNDFGLLAIPLFILMGAIIAATRAGSDLYEGLHRWLHRLPGGLAVSNLAATPRVGPSTQRPLQRRRWDDAKRTQGTAAAATAPTSRGVGSAAPWAAEGWDAGATPSGWTTPSDGPVAPLPVQGGASDAFRR